MINHLLLQNDNNDIAVFSFITKLFRPKEKERYKTKIIYNPIFLCMSLKGWSKLIHF